MVRLFGHAYINPFTHENKTVDYIVIKQMCHGNICFNNIRIWEDVHAYCSLLIPFGLNSWDLQYADDPSCVIAQCRFSRVKMLLKYNKLFKEAHDYPL